MSAAYRLHWIVVALVVAQASGVEAQSPPPLYREGELLIRFKPQRLQSDLLTVQSWVKEVFTDGDPPPPPPRALDDDGELFLVTLPPKLNTLEALNSLQASRAITNFYFAPVNAADDVQRAELNYLYQATGIPDDTCFSKQWALNPSSAFAIHATTAWETTKGQGAIVAVIDSGIDIDQPELKDRVLRNPGLECSGTPGKDDDDNGFRDDCYGYDAVSKGGDPKDLMEGNLAHGTAVAGIIAAAEDHAGIVGVSPEATLVVCRALNDTGLGSTDEIITCLRYIRKVNERLRRESPPRHIAATNNSYASSKESAELKDEIVRQAADNILFVTAAGNDGGDVDTPNVTVYPAEFALDNMITVAALGTMRGDLGSSNYGESSVHLCAPGREILCSQPTWGTALCAGEAVTDADVEVEGVKLAEDTSMAAPHVTGVAALIAAATPTVDWKEIKRRIVKCGVADGLSGKKTSSGVMLDAAKALSCP